MAKTIEEHYGYLSDRVKVAQYQEAINRLVRSEHVVLDLGCGSGLLGLMALRAGARKVYFVEEGMLELCIEDKSYLLEEGDIYIIAPGTVHWAKGEGTRVKVLSSPIYSKDDHYIV